MSRKDDVAPSTRLVVEDDEPRPEHPTDLLVIRSKDLPPPEDGSIPTVRVHPPTVGPAYSKDLIRRVIRRGRPALRACYDELRIRSPERRGRCDLRFTIDASGGVVRPSLVTTALADAAFEACAVAVIAGAHFPAPPGGGQLEVTYPVVFIPEGWPSLDDQAPPGRQQPP